MPFSDLDRAAVARALAQIAQHEDDRPEAYFERLEEVELPPDTPPARGAGGGQVPGLAVRREDGFALRLSRGGRSWLAARDGIEPRLFAEALRQVARVLPTAVYPEPQLPVRPWPGPPRAEEMLAFPSRLQRAIRTRHVAFPLGLTLRRHRRHIQVVHLDPSAEGERESFYSCAVELPWGGYGTLFTELDEGTVDRLASTLVGLFRSRHALPPEAFQGTVVLAPAAAAVLLHEAVAHALEADVLAQGGKPDAAVGVELGSSLLNVLDDPGAAPKGVRRSTDDEGVPICRRWLLRAGVVAEPLADTSWASGSDALIAGAGRRGGRHSAPSPRSSHLELLPGTQSIEELLAGAEGGLYIAEARRGALDPESGRFELEVPYARRIRGGIATDPVGRCRIIGRVAELLAGVNGLGSDARAAGAGWCAKGGRKLPVWATCPTLRIEGVEIEP